MLALLLIPILVSGYIMIIANPYHYFVLHRFHGQLLYLKVATLGTFCLLVSSLILSLLFFYSSFDLPTEIPRSVELNGLLEKYKPHSMLISLSFLSILFSIFYVFIIYIKNYFLGIIFFYYKKNVYKTYKQSRLARVLRKTLGTGTFDSFLLNVGESNPKEPVLINLSSKKIYVGVVSGTTNPTEKDGPNTHVSIFPLMSGYRDKDTSVITFTSTYPERTVENNASNNGINKPSILILASEITHISPFDFKLYSDINPVKKDVNSDSDSKKSTTKASKKTPNKKMPSLINWKYH